MFSVRLDKHQSYCGGGAISEKDDMRGDVLFTHGKRCFTTWKEKVCQKWDSNPRLENQTAT